LPTPETIKKAKAPAIPAPWQDWHPPKYSFAAFRGDLMGGLVAALIALPYGLAMATLMGLPPTMGLMTSILTAPVTAVLGRNPVLIGGTSTVTVPFLAAAVAAYGPGGAAKITIVAAVFLMVFCVLRLGGLLATVPRPVVSGFSCGIGAMMIISQLKALFGLKIISGAGSTGTRRRRYAGAELASSCYRRGHDLRCGGIGPEMAIGASAHDRHCARGLCRRGVWLAR